MKAQKIISAVLAFSLAMGINAQMATKENYLIGDINSHWAEKELTTLINAGILKGSDTKAMPDAKITRGEFTALTSRTLALSSDGDGSFSDIPPTHMFFSEIDAASDAGIVTGTGGGKFLSDRTITREEIMLIIARCLPEEKETSIKFSDIGSNYKYTEELENAVSSGIITGFTDGTFRPYAKASRAECVVMLERLLKAMPPADEDELGKIEEEYIKNDLSDTDANIDITSGLALNETYDKLDAQKIIQSLSTQTEKLTEGMKLISRVTNGHLSKSVYEGDITYITTNTNGTRQRTYRATYIIDTIQTDDTLYVYNSDLSLAKKDKINLTWEVYSTPPDTAPFGVNVISPSSFQISAKELGVESNPLISGAKFYNSLTRKYMDFAKKNGYEVWPIYKTDFTLKTAHDFLNNKEARKKSIEYLLGYACKYLIDGINVDFENIYASNHHLISKHVRELSTALHEMGLVVSVDITRREPTSANWSMCYDRDLLNKNADYVMLMAYDEYYASSKTPGSVASLDWTEESIIRTLGEVDNSKLILGIPFYMRYFETQNGKVTSSKAISMQTAYDYTQANNVKYEYINKDKQYKISWKNGSKTCVFWLENTDTVAMRVNLANEHKLAGVASWRRGLEISKVWNTIAENLSQ